MKKLYRLALCTTILAICACESENIAPDSPDYGADITYKASKIINSPSERETDNLLLRLSGEPDAMMLDELKAKGVISIERVFSSTPGKEELEKRFNLDKWYVATLSEDSDLEYSAKLLTNVKAVELVQYEDFVTKASDCISYPYFPSAVPTKSTAQIFNDPSLNMQWHYHNTGSKNIATDAYAGGDINVKDVWEELTTGDRSIIVAVVDEGVKYSHPDLVDNMWTGPDGSHGHNFVTDGPITWAEVDDAGNGDSGHGTHCAGTIAAVNNNGIGVSGVAGGSGNKDGVQIMSCQIFDGVNPKSGSCVVSSQAIKYAADNGASIISCSFGYKGGSYKSDGSYLAGNNGMNSMEYDAIKYFEATKNNDVLDGGIAIFASGNDGLAYATYPGAMNDVISVSAFGPDYLPAYYSNYGPGCNIVAPGGEAYHLNTKDNYLIYGMVLSTVPSELNDGADYAYMQGTSMACPHVSGVVALALSYAKKLGKKYTVKEFKDMIITSANDFDKRLIGQKTLYNMKPIELYQYAKMMGTGSLDAWKLMMKIEGIPSVIVENGTSQWVDISPYFGTSSVNLEYLDVEAVGDTESSLGLAEKPYIKYGRLFIHPTKIGSGKIKITAVGGGNIVGGEEAIGGMKVSQEVSVISRNVVSQSGGWL